MIDQLPTGRRGQLLAGAVTVILLAVLWVGIASPLMQWYAGRSENLQARRLVEDRMSAIAATVPALLVQTSAAQVASPKRQNALIQATTDALAAAVLQQKAQEMASAAGANFASVETLPVEQQQAYRRIALRVTFSSSWPVLVHLLQRFETATPRILAEDLDLAASPVLAHADGVPVQTTLTIAAFRAGTTP
jgi:hypothetical protein